MNRRISGLVAGLVFLTLGSRNAHAQRTSSLQVIAQVVDSRAAWSGLESARELAASWTADSTRAATIEAGYAQVSLAHTALPPTEARPETLLALRIDYLRN